MLVKFDRKAEKVRVSLRTQDLLDEMDRRELLEGDKRPSLWRPEFGGYMIEGTPGKPFGNSHESGIVSYFNQVEDNMKLRRKEIEKLLLEDESLLTLTSFPR